MGNTTKSKWLAIIGPGLLVAATGVGAGDLATGAFSGSALGPAVLWAVLVGSFLKYVLSEGLARFQLSTGETLLEGALSRSPAGLRWLFLLYLLPWSWFVGSALIRACGATAQAAVPILGDGPNGALVWGAVHSMLGLTLVWRGGYALFEKLMGVAVGIMFVTVVWTAIALGFDGQEVLRGLFIPSLPDAGGEGFAWTLALMGGVGGTLTLLCYGYWIREEGRTGPEHLGLCRLDLALGFTVTAIFGVAMVLIGSRVETTGKGAGLIVDLANELENELGTGARWAFLIGAWGAVFSSLVGVWQAVPYIFADFWRLRGGRSGAQTSAVDTSGRPYRGYMLALALVPLLAYSTSFKQAQKAYAVVGVAFLPLLALSLLWLNRECFVGADHKNRWPAGLALLFTLAFFLIAGAMRITS
ncbi:MAG: Mn2+/Fe2+ NRAMP family transporter [Candidatus Paceibacteria bacterium]